DCSPDDVVELANGCICCTVADDFIPTMELLLARDPAPDHIVIETSGLALPQPLVQAFNWPEVKSRVTVDGVVTVIDAPAVAAGTFAAKPEAVALQRAADDNLDHESPLHELFEDQLGCADLIVLNKRDLLSGDELARVRHIVDHDRRDTAQVIEASHGKLPVDVLLGLGQHAEDDLATRHGHHHHGDDDTDGTDHHAHDHDDFDSAVLVLPAQADARLLAAQLASVIADRPILRVKGFLEIEGKPMRCVVQGVGGRIDTYFDRPWRGDEDRQGRLVVIGLKGLDFAAIAAALNAEVARA
ncbi:MAG: cobalamin biosynthesis protein CobW, partial [Pseudomonadota bacterium]